MKPSIDFIRPTMTIPHHLRKRSTKALRHLLRAIDAGNITDGHGSKKLRVLASAEIAIRRACRQELDAATGTLP